MVKILNLFGDSYSGQAGKAGVFAKWKGRQYRRKYVIPANPKTTMQMVVRGYFKNAVALWHVWSSLQRLVFSYLATGQVMSGFNLLVRRYQKAATSGATLPLAPQQGIKQICSASEAGIATNMVGENPFPLDPYPVKIKSLTYTPLGTDTEVMAAYVDLEMADVRIPTRILGTLGEVAAPATPLAEGDKLLISYSSGGRDVVREELATAEVYDGNGGYCFPVADYRTKYYPIDLESVVVEIVDVSATPDTYAQVNSLEILCCDYSVADSVVTPTPKVFFDLAVPEHASSKVDYIQYTQIAGAKLEVTKVDTSFITWRRYSDPIGQILIAQTIEDETYDWKLSAPLYLDVIRAAQSAVLASKHELVTMASAV